MVKREDKEGKEELIPPPVSKLGVQYKKEVGAKGAKMGWQ